MFNFYIRRKKGIIENNFIRLIDEDLDLTIMHKRFVIPIIFNCIYETVKGQKTFSLKLHKSLDNKKVSKLCKAVALNVTPLDNFSLWRVLEIIHDF